MTRRSLRELEHDLSKLKDKHGDSRKPGVSFRVEYREAAPDERPTGIEWDTENGVIWYDLWDAQRDTLDALESGENDIVATLAGYGSGKTIFGARRTIENALRYDNSRFLAMGIDFQKARDTTFRVLFEQLPCERTGVVTSSFNGPEQSPIVADYSRRHHRLTLINDTVIKLGSADRWNRYAGDEYGGIWLDEPSHYGDDLHDLLEMLGSRLRGVEGPKTQLWTLTGNGYNAAFRILSKREDKDGEKVNLNIEVIRASTVDNPYLSPSDIERFRRQYEGTAREDQALHGGFQAAQGLVYPMFSRDTHVIPHSEATELVRDDWRSYGYDAGWRDPKAVVEVGKSDYGQFVVLDEYRKSGVHIEDVIHWFKQNDKPPGKIYCEHAPEDIDRLRRGGLHAVNAEKALEPGISEVRKRFEIDENDKPGLLISENCEHLIREILNYKEEEVGTSAAVDHCADSLRYCVLTERGNRANWLEDWADEQEADA